MKDSNKIFLHMQNQNENVIKQFDNFCSGKAKLIFRNDSRIC